MNTIKKIIKLITYTVIGTMVAIVGATLLLADFDQVELPAEKVQVVETVDKRAEAIERSKKATGPSTMCRLVWIQEFTKTNGQSYNVGFDSYYASGANASCDKMVDTAKAATNGQIEAMTWIDSHGRNIIANSF